jgi:hypothetical protein
MTKSFEFILVLKGVDRATNELANALFEAGCDDGTLYSSAGEAAVGFTREAASLEEAIRSAIANVLSAGVSVARAEPAE